MKGSKPETGLTCSVYSHTKGMENRHPGGLLRRLEEKRINAPPPLASSEAGEAARSERELRNKPVSQPISFVPHVQQFCHAIAWSQGTVRARWRGGVEAHSLIPTLSLHSSVSSLLDTQSKFTQAGGNPNPHSYKSDPIVATGISYGIQNDKSIITACA